MGGGESGERAERGGVREVAEDPRQAPGQHHHHHQEEEDEVVMVVLRHAVPDPGTVVVEGLQL